MIRHPSPLLQPCRRPPSRRPIRAHTPEPPQCSARSRRSTGLHAPVQLAQLVIIALAIVAAAGWGLAPVLIEQAQRALGGNSATMMLMSQAIVLVLVLPIVVARRRVLLRPLREGERKLLIALVLASAALESVFAIAYYFLIDNT